MKIKRKTFEHRGKFGAVLICEHCEWEMKITSGENSPNWYDNKLPKMICSNCEKNRLGKKTTRFFPGGQIP